MDRWDGQMGSMTGWTDGRTGGTTGWTDGQTDSMAVWTDQMGIWDEPDGENEEEMDDGWRRLKIFFSPPSLPIFSFFYFNFSFIHRYFS